VGVLGKNTIAGWLAALACCAPAVRLVASVYDATDSISCWCEGVFVALF
jgi:hypothetical protein